MAVHLMLNVLIHQAVSHVFVMKDLLGTVSSVQVSTSSCHYIECGNEKTAFYFSAD